MLNLKLSHPDPQPKGQSISVELPLGMRYRTYPLLGGDCQFFFGVFDGAQLTFGLGNSDQYAFHMKFRGSLREAGYAVPAMCGCKNLHVDLVGVWRTIRQ